MSIECPASSPSPGVGNGLSAFNTDHPLRKATYSYAHTVSYNYYSYKKLLTNKYRTWCELAPENRPPAPAEGDRYIYRTCWDDSTWRASYFGQATNRVLTENDDFKGALLISPCCNSSVSFYCRNGVGGSILPYYAGANPSFSAQPDSSFSSTSEPCTPSNYTNPDAVCDPRYVDNYGNALTYEEVKNLECAPFVYEPDRTSGVPVGSGGVEGAGLISFGCVNTDANGKFTENGAPYLLDTFIGTPRTTYIVYYCYKPTLWKYDPDNPFAAILHPGEDLVPNDKPYGTTFVCPEAIYTRTDSQFGHAVVVLNRYTLPSKFEYKITREHSINTSNTSSGCDAGYGVILSYLAECRESATITINFY